MFEHVSVQTNPYAAQLRIASKRSDKWIPTNKNEIKRIFELIIWTGVVNLRSLPLFWTRDPLFAQTFPRKVMNSDRFEILMRMLHFANSRVNDASDSLSTIKFITLRGRIIFKQYLKQIKHKYGIKVFKLCCNHGLTYNFHVYARKVLDKESTTPSNIVRCLSNNLFHKGHTLCADNWYTRVDLANKLIEKNTHLIVLKWKNKRDGLVLSTKHSSEMINVITKRGFCRKPKIIAEYNKAKTSIDLSDQMSVYSSPLRRTLKYYKKLAFELLPSTAIVNAMFIFQEPYLQFTEYHRLAPLRIALNRVAQPPQKSRRQRNRPAIVRIAPPKQLITVELIRQQQSSVKRRIAPNISTISTMLSSTALNSTASTIEHRRQQQCAVERSKAQQSAEYQRPA
ncbi:PREDICTED: piggyBac transposable element-derived protein 4-like [Eufriesea mexicana]|uniref:piggyBac transposable element-derived protein 4-like n=1 Tax=Eufriesea mexicana TaxID=516756 RepID=UPI00083C7410|nr:PREDICTED: piggyBac transposable element-derived protein 4-like [Eufriesea mexicana]